MCSRRTLAAIGMMLLAATPSPAQWLGYANYRVGRTGSDFIVRPPAYAYGFGVANPNQNPIVFVPGSGYVYAPNYTGLRPSYWSLPGRYNAYPWSGAGVYTGGTGVYAFYPPWFYGSGADVGLAYPYGYYAPYDGAYAPAFQRGTLYQAPSPTASYSPYGVAREPEPAAPPDRAILQVDAPAGAQVTAQADATKQPGSESTFVSPQIAPGGEYKFDVKVQWQVDGKAQEQTQSVTVRAGHRSQLLLLGGAAAKAPANPQK